MKKDIMPYDAFPIYVARIPLVSFNVFQELFNNVNIKEKIKEFVKQPIINEAIFIATPEFYFQLNKWISGKQFVEKEEQRILFTLYKYISRMATRSTPFGLFAGCFTGTFSSKSEIILEETLNHKRSTQLDMFYLCELAKHLSKHYIIKKNIKYYPNNTLFEYNDRIRYIEYRYNNKNRTHHVVQIKKNKILLNVLKEAYKGVYYDRLVQVVEKEGADKHTSIDYIENLIMNQILISELEPSIFGTEFFSQILNVLSPIKGVDDIKNNLYYISKKLNEIDKKVGNPTVSYYDVVSSIEKLNVDYNIKYLFQTNLNVSTKISKLSYSVIDSVKSIIVLFNKITIYEDRVRLKKFKDEFIKRYETREMPLLKVLDPEIGISYQIDELNLIDDFALYNNIVLPSKSYNIKNEIDIIRSFLLEKLLDSANINSDEIEISDNDLSRFKLNWEDLPLTFSIILKILENKSAKYPQGKFFIEGAGGSTAGRLLGRFCSSNSHIYELVKNIVEHEKNLAKEEILAEIVYLPESRVGNVIHRPEIRDYNISIGIENSTYSCKSIPLNDLYVSVINDEMILRSKSLNKRVLPRLTNAQNYSMYSIPIYQFLCDIQNQGIRSWIGFSWGDLLYKSSFLPRITYKNIIISPAIWIIKYDEIDIFLKMKDDKELLKKIKIWRDTRKLPKTVLLEDNNDNYLFIHFNNILSIKTFLFFVKYKNKFILKEFLFDINNPLIKSSKGAFVNEFILGFYKKNEQYEQQKY